MVKYYTAAISFLVLLAGCGSSPVAVEPEPETVTGEWSGLIYESSSYDIYLTLYVEDNYGIGSTEYYMRSYDRSTHYATTASFMGTPDHFFLHLDVGLGYDPPWAYTGYVEDGALCLVRDALPEPVRCLMPGLRTRAETVLMP